MVSLENLGFKYQDTMLFEHCDHTFSDHAIHAIIGRSGCGKTTLLYLLAALLQPQQGSVSFDGRNLSDQVPDRAIILQDFGMLPWKRVYDNIALALRLRHTPETIVRQKTETVMEELGIASLRSAFPARLSGGEKQRCAIARSLVLEPKLLLMDEPFSALDAMNREQMQELLLDLSTRHAMTCLLVTHSIEEAAYLADYIHVMERTGKEAVQFLPVIENLHARNPEYRLSEAYFSCCVQTRQLLGKGGRG
ncbi:MAG: ABC transporter ATP-binding protein [Sphaerochaeta sp.]|jgi:NitT/TauT family transport system ATP-binding protein|uniref:ABC transporter ATP-binding protein n=1 Tax=Sphaerochaeta sp. TaxID=1972642 RepID=UPI002FC98E32